MTHRHKGLAGRAGTPFPRHGIFTGRAAMVGWVAAPDALYRGIGTDHRSAASVPSTFVTREVYYAPAQMFALVADVERYPEFVPFWQAVRVRNRRPGGYHTDQVVRLGPVRHTFSTDTSLREPAEIHVFSQDPPFRFLSLRWTFDHAEDDGCRISLDVDFQLRSLALRALGALLSREAITRMIDAFETRARSIYGPPPQESHD